MALDYRKLSQDQLIDLLKERDEALDFKDAEIKSLTAKVSSLGSLDKVRGQDSASLAAKYAELEAKYTALFKDNAVLTQKNEGLQAQVDTLLKVEAYLTEALPAVREFLAVIEERQSGDLVCDRMIWDAFKSLLDQIRRDAEATNSIRQVFKKGNDSLRQADSIAKATGDVPGKLKQLASDTAALTQSIKELGQVVKTAMADTAKGQQDVKEDPVTAGARQAMNNTFSSNSPEKPEPAPKRSPGRVKQEPDLTITVECAPEDIEAARCSCGGKLVLVSQYIEKIKQTAGALGEKLDKLVMSHVDVRIMVCEKDQKIVVFLPRQANVPVIPGHNLGLRPVIETEVCEKNGVPPNRTQALIHPDLNLGHETTNKAVKDHCKIYLKPLYEACMLALGMNPVNIMDGTTFSCLKNEGKGSCKSPHTKKNSQTYVLAATTPDHAPIPVAWYTMIRSRAAASIAEKLPKGFNPEVLITDAYGGYDKLLEEFKHLFKKAIKHGRCWVHLRREIQKALNIKSWKGAIRKLDEERRQGLLQKGYEELSPRVLLLALIENIRLIYRHEDEIKLKPGEKADDAYFAKVMAYRQANERPLVENVNAIMKKLAAGDATRCCKSGKYIKGKNPTAATKVATYYLNSREELELFLHDGRVSPDSNAVERTIRSLTLLRKNSNFMNTPKGLQNVCMIYTVYETAELNGIETPIQWMLDYSHALWRYAVGKKWGTVVNKTYHTHDMNKNFKNWSDFAEMAKGFEKTKEFQQFLPWNYGKTNEEMVCVDVELPDEDEDEDDIEVDADTDADATDTVADATV